MRRHTATLVLALGLPLLWGPARAAANEGGFSLFVRQDSDATTVVAPRVTAVGVIEDRTRITGSYSADVWTSASIDIRTAATATITEQRDQLDFSLSHEFDDVTIGGAYYYSGENDYLSHGFTLRSVQELSGNTTTLEENIRFVYDEVGRSGDQTFNRPSTTYGAKLVLTQILSPEAILQFAFEGMIKEGFQSSPYRYVGLGGDGVCGWNPDGDSMDGLGAPGTAELCLPERHPELRARGALVGRFRYAFSDDSSAGLGARAYVDSWAIYSATVAAQVAWIPAPNQVLTLRYRFYTQTQAYFYESVYQADTRNTFFITRDRELTRLFSNRIAISYQGVAQLSEDVSLRVALAVGGTVFVYSNFVGLDEVFSLDVTSAVTLDL